MGHHSRQRFTDEQVVEVYDSSDKTWHPGIVEVGRKASPQGDYLFADGYDVAVWVRGDRQWVRNDRRRVRPYEGRAE